MFCDYGHYFFWHSIQESRLPKVPDPTAGDLTRLTNDRKDMAEFYSFVAEVARHIIAHGIFMYGNHHDPKYDKICNSFHNIINKDWPENEEEWKMISDWVVNTADSVFSWLMEWGDLWEVQQDKDKKDLMEAFYYGRWKYSINRDECNSVGPETVWKPNHYNLYNEKDTSITSFARVFSSQMFYDVLTTLSIAAPPDCRSDYVENSKYWKNRKPEVNWRLLYTNINFIGVENVRKELKNKAGDSVCPDCFRLYLEGLTCEMANLPRENSVSNGNSVIPKRTHVPKSY